MSLPTWLTVIKLPMPSLLGEVNSFLIRGPDGAALIDTGVLDTGSQSALEQALLQENLSTSDIKKVLCTHHHPDHCGLAKLFQNNGAQIYMSQADAKSLLNFWDKPDNDQRRAVFFEHHEVPDIFAQRIVPMIQYFRKMQSRFVPDVYLEAGTVVDLCGIPIEVIDTPGHTLGHLCFGNTKEKILFTGDHLLNDKATHVSVRDELFGIDLIAQLLSSLEKIAQLGDYIGMAGHGETIENTGVRATQLIGFHRVRLTRLLGILSAKPQTALDLCTSFFGPIKNPYGHWICMAQTIAYLQHLVTNGFCESIHDQFGKLRYFAKSDMSY